MSARPEASIVINNFNYGRFLGDAIESALAQRDAIVEVVVVDDGSTDDSHDVVAAFGDRVVAVLQANGGQASAFNAGVEAASGDAILFLDADDRFRPDKARRVCDALAEADVEWCFHPLAFIDERGAPLPSPADRPPLPAGRVDARPAVRAGDAPPFVAPATTALAFRSSLARRILPMPVELRITADNYVKAVALGLAAGRVLADELAEQRLHGANAYTGATTNGAAARRTAIELQVAHALHERWPELRRYALGRALGAMRTIGRAGADPAAVEAADRFVAACTPTERARIAAHRLAWRVRG